MRLQKTFVQGRMNKDIDERLLPQGQYSHAENVRASTSDNSALGSLQNLKGNFKITDLGVTNGQTLGAYTDSSNQKIYWFVTSNEKDMLIEYNVASGVTSVILESTAGSGALKFSRDYRITGIVKIINGDAGKDLLLWTDDLNPPRCINIERFRGSAIDSFTSEDISLIKAPPKYAPSLTPSYQGVEYENSIEDKFLAFAYRYKYVDGEYSALSSFTNYSFFPQGVNIDFQTMENKGMKNSFNTILIKFNTGGKNVVGIDLVFKESNSNNVHVIQSFNKEDEKWADNSAQSFSFNNSKNYKVLPEDELFRTYDNVPIKAKALDLIVNRIVFGNYEEGYDMVDKNGDKVVANYLVSVETEDISGGTLPITSTNLDKTAIIDFTDTYLKKGGKLTVTMSISELTTSGFYRGTFDFVLNKDYATANELAADVDFIYFIETVFTNDFLDNTDMPYVDPQDPYLEPDPYAPPTSDVLIGHTGFEIIQSTATSISIAAPVVTYDTTGTKEWAYNIGLYGTSVTLVGFALATTLKTNRTYEVGIIYLDEYNRASLPVISKTNTVTVSQSSSENKNMLRVAINHNPPYWAERYKLVVKQDKGDYHNIFASVFYEEGVYRWIKLEGENRNKVKEGDALIVKSDLSGVLDIPVRIKVLEVAQKASNFIEGNKLPDNTTDLIEEAGLYMKVKPVGVNLDFNASAVKSFSGSQGLRYPTQCYTSPSFANPEGGTSIAAGSRVNIKIRFEAFGSISYLATYDRTFVVQADYATVKDWFDAEVKNLGEFGQTYTRAGGDAYRRGGGWDFSPDGTKFWVQAHREGTATRDIYTSVSFDIFYTRGVAVFETEGEEISSDIFYETEETFDINKATGAHLGNQQDQGAMLPAVVVSSFYNAYTQGNGVESYRFMDGFNTPRLNIDLRPTMVATEEYKRVRRYADLTYSEPYNENNSLNGLNEFNLSRANYKEDIDKSYGSIQRLFSRDSDILLFQEDKVSKVLYGKDLLMNADGTSNLSSINDVLGQQIPYMGEYGISTQPESFAFNGFYTYFTDAKRGAVLRLAADGINEVSKMGMDKYFKDNFTRNLTGDIIGGYDPYNDEYILSSDNDTLMFSDSAKGWVSFVSYTPEAIVGINNTMYSFKGGDLYVHDSDSANRNTFYGVQYPSSVSMIFNDSPSEIKAIKAMSLEGNGPWNASITAFVSAEEDTTMSSVDAAEFVKKEGVWYSYTRRNESELQLDSKSAYGVGMVTAINGTTISVNGFNSFLSYGDKIVNTSLGIVGTVANVLKSPSGCIITLDTVNNLSVDSFIVGVKNPRIEGGNLRGYSIKVSLDTIESTKAELFAVNMEVFKSRP